MLGGLYSFSLNDIWVIFASRRLWYLSNIMMVSTPPPPQSHHTTLMPVAGWIDWLTDWVRLNVYETLEGLYKTAFMWNWIYYILRNFSPHPLSTMSETLWSFYRFVSTVVIQDDHGHVSTVVIRDYHRHVLVGRRVSPVCASVCASVADASVGASESTTFSSSCLR